MAKPYEDYEDEDHEVRIDVVMKECSSAVDGGSRVTMPVISRFA